MTCPICSYIKSESWLILNKLYKQCQQCQCVYTKNDISDVMKTQRDGDRSHQDQGRIDRILPYLNKNDRILDFGCGNGTFIKKCQENGLNAFGIDLDTKKQLPDVINQSVKVIHLTEVIEHIISPKKIVSEFLRILKPGGIIYIETSFIDFIGTDSSYISPEIGHVLVHSRKSIEMLFGNFQPKWINNNVVLFIK